MPNVSTDSHEYQRACESAGVLGSVTRWLSSQGRTQTLSWLSRFAHDLTRFHALLVAVSLPSVLIPTMLIPYPLDLNS